jgi:hypothetical protein
MPEKERLRAEAERAAGLEAAEKEILNAGLPLPAEADDETASLENEADGATPETGTSNAF